MPYHFISVKAFENTRVAIAKLYVLHAWQYAIVLITIKDLKQDNIHVPVRKFFYPNSSPTPPTPHPQTHFLVCMQLTLGLSRELAPCPLPGAAGAKNP